MTSGIYEIERELDLINSKFRHSSNKPLTIKTYLSFANQKKILVRGRVLEPKQIKPSGLNDSAFENFVRNLHLIDSDEVSFAKVEIQCNSTKALIVANEEGFIEEIIEAKTSSQKSGQCLLTLTGDLQNRQLKETYSAAFIAPQKADFGVISDIDDTILKTNVHNLFKMARQILFGNAYSRLLFDGVKEFYHALHQGKNPIFYVSNSPWNLYDILAEVFKLNNLPVGPIILRDWGLDANNSVAGNKKKNKIYEIKRIFEFYPKLKFILVGDSGQQDPEIYSQIVAAYPRRILAVYIRDVSGIKRDAEIKLLSDKLKEHDIDLVLAESTDVFFEHAREQGFIAKLLKPQ